MPAYPTQTTTWLKGGFVSLFLILCLGAKTEITERVEFVNGRGEILQTHGGALRFYGAKKPEESPSIDVARFKIQLHGFLARPSPRLSIVAVDPVSGIERDRLNLGALKPDEKGVLSSRWLVLVSSRSERNNANLLGRAILAELGDRIEARVRIGGGRARITAIHVGGSKEGDDEFGIREFDLRLTVISGSRGIGSMSWREKKNVRAVLHHQVKILNEVLAQCLVRARYPRQIVIAPPPTGCLLSVGGGLGLPSSGGFVRVMVEDEPLGPFKVGTGFTPEETARLISHHLIQAGYLAEVSMNPKPGPFALGTADIVVRNADGSLARMMPWPDEPLTTDSRQTLEIGAVDIHDGIDAYDDNFTHCGTLEERTLVKSLSDGDERTLDIFIVNRFSPVTKQGESFVRSSGSSLSNTALIDVDSLLRARHSYTLPHEVGHILLDDLGHPDDIGPVRTDLLMHSRSSSAIDGPRRLTEEECDRIRIKSDYLFR